MVQLTPRRPGGKHYLTNHWVKYLKSIGCQRTPSATSAVQRARLQSRALRHRGDAMKASRPIPHARRRDKSRAHSRTRKLNCGSCGKPISHHAGRRPNYCSARCRMREFGKGRSRKAFLGGIYRCANETPKNP